MPFRGRSRYPPLERVHTAIAGLLSGFRAVLINRAR